jgi:predicted amidophosphoribosyltransferase
VSHPVRSIPCVLHELVRLVFPARCPGCGRAGEPLCVDCAQQLRAPARVSPPPGVDAWVAPFSYEGVARELVARVKYRDERAAVPWLALAMAAAVRDAGVECVDAITWAPTTPSRHRARGFDPAALLARALAQPLDRPTRAMLARLPGPPQTGRSGAARHGGPRFRPLGRPVARVLVVDDIATSGATLAAAASTLRAHGVGSVVAVTAARTPRGRAPLGLQCSPAD